MNYSQALRYSYSLAKSAFALYPRAVRYLLTYLRGKGGVDNTCVENFILCVYTYTFLAFCQSKILVKVVCLYYITGIVYFSHSKYIKF